MIRDAMIIYRKELRNLSKDRRTLFSTFLLPLLVMPVIFIGMGTVIGSMERDAEETVYRISLDGNRDPRFIALLSEGLDYRLTSDPADSDISVWFPPSYAPGAKASVRIVYDSSSRKIQYAAQAVISAVRAYDTLVANDLLARHGLSAADLNTLVPVSVDTATEAARSGGSVLSMMAPYFLIIFLFAGSMNAGLDTTSGEKERGSLAALLVNQVPRSSIAWGKILYVLTVATCSAAATFVGLLITLESSAGSLLFSSDAGAGSIGIGGLAIVVVGLFSTALLTASLVTLLGCLAKTVREGTGYVMPLYMLVVLIGVMTMYMDPTANPLLFLIPIVNTIFCMKEAFMGMGSFSHTLMMAVSNLTFAMVCAMAVSRLFNSERILRTV